MNQAAQTVNMVISFYDYVALLPTMIVACIVSGLTRRKD